MKTSILQAFLLIHFTVFFPFTLLAQKPVLNFSGQNARCGTGLVMENFFKKHPELRSEFDHRQQEFQVLFKKIVAQRANQAGVFKSGAIITIPVVVHIVLPDPTIVTDAQVISQITTLNNDYGGTNNDSLNIPAAFKPVFGKSQIRFCLAQRNPFNEPTNGIERKVSGTSSVSGSGDPIKYSSQGGADAWDPSKYLNIWVCQMQSGALGYSFLPGTPIPAVEMGFVNAYENFGSGGTATPPFNLGRTATHEIGHFLNLIHIWGSNTCVSSCTDDDGVSDTPLQERCFFGTPVFPQTDACTTTGAGVMFMNYMDYVDDVAMFMFTQQQALKMETAMSSFADRSPLLVSDGCTAPPVLSLDARVRNIIFPTASSTTCNTSISPIVVIRNSGSTTLNSVTLNIQIDALAPVVTNLPVNILPYSEMTVTASPISVAAGNHTMKVYTNSPNGGVDENPSNDTANTSFAISVTVATPMAEGFESSTFPPPGWSTFTTGTPDLNWQRVTTASHSGSASIKFDNYNLDQFDQYGELRSPLLNVNGGDSLSLSFWVAAAVYDNTVIDTLEVLVSPDCGNSYISIYKKWGAALATRPGFVTSPFTPTSTEWRREVIGLNQYISAGTLIIAFRNINEFGNNIYIDDINVNKSTLPTDNVAVTAITDPFDFVCNMPVKPHVTLTNLGKDTLRKVKIIYNLDGGPIKTKDWTGALPRLESISVELDELSTAVGLHRFKVYTAEPNGGADADPSNDTAFRNFNYKEIRTSPIIESFEGPSFPPAQWDRLNPDNNISWVLTQSTSSSGTASIYINNYNYSILGSVDQMISPLVQYSNVDSVYIGFAVAAATYSYPGYTQVPLDTLEVLVSQDCGKTYHSVYKKWGEDLQTLGKPNEPFTAPFVPRNASQWRKELINVTNILGKSNTFLVAFKNTNNFENNIFLDDINIFTRTLPPRLKDYNYLISPNPFQNGFVLQLYPNARNLKAIEVYSATGQLVHRKNFGTGTADAYQQVDLSRQPAGMYNVRIIFVDRIATEKVIKLQ